MADGRDVCIVTGAARGIGEPPGHPQRRPAPGASARAAARTACREPCPATPPSAGREVAAGLMQRGRHVILACRDMGACEAAAAALAAAHPAGGCECSQ